MGAGFAAARGRDGFVLAFVVFMLFSVSVAAATGYLVVNSEFGMARNSSDGSEALVVARAGLERFIAEQIGAVPDTVSYALGDGVAVVTNRRLFARDSVTAVYYVRSEGTVADVFAPNTPARRVVGAYAIRHGRPMPHYAAVMTSAQTLNVQGGGSARGMDFSTTGDCPGGNASTITGAIARSSVTEDVGTAVQGSPQWQTWSGGYTAMLDSIRLRWDVLSDPDLPVDYDGIWPSYASLPADSFPVVRQHGWITPNSYGRGVLIVDGTFDPGASFEWDGIVLAGQIDDIVEGTVNGILVAGLGSNNLYNTVTFGMDILYFSCNVYGANESLAYFELIDDTVFEAR